MLQAEITGDGELEEVLLALAGALNPDDVLDEGAAVLLNRIKTRFLQETAPDGTKWKPSLASILRKKRGQGGGTLFASGTLYHSLQLFTEGPGTRSIGSDVPYGVKHQLGLDGMEQRVFLGLNDEDVAVMTKLIYKRVTDALGG